MKIGTIFGTCIGGGMLIGLMIGQEYMSNGLWVGIGLGAVIILIKNKKDEDK